MPRGLNTSAAGPTQRCSSSYRDRRARPDPRSLTAVRPRIRTAPKRRASSPFANPLQTRYAPNPELLRRLTAAQKADLKFLGALCETGVRDSGAGIEVGCSCCSPFDQCGPVRGGRPRGNVDEVYRMVTRSEGSFTEPGARELAVTFFGCEPHVSNWGGTMLYRRLKDSWSFVSYTSGVRPDRCQPYRLQEGRDVLICQWADAHQSIGRAYVFVYDFVAPDRRCWTDLVDFIDDSSLCEGEPGKPLTWSSLDRVRIRHLNHDRILDRPRRRALAERRAVQALSRRLHGKPEYRSSSHACTAGGRTRIARAVEAVGLDFVSDGRSFKPASDPAPR